MFVEAVEVTRISAFLRIAEEAVHCSNLNLNYWEELEVLECFLVPVVMVMLSH